MCGIAGVHVKSAHLGRFPLDRFVDELFLGIEHRGRDASGYVAVNDEGEVMMQKAPVKASLFTRKRKTIPNSARTVLLHTRLATQGLPAFSENNHPVLYETCFVTHNGHIHNDDEIFKELDIPRNAEVDSAAIAAALSYHGIASWDDVKAALESLRGGFAIAAIDPEQKKGRLLLARGTSSPLWVLNHPKAIVWASTKGAILEAWGRILGTPPSRNANFFQGKYDGISDLGIGRCFVIDGDEFVYEKFSTSSFRTSSSTSSENNSDLRGAASSFGEDWSYYGCEVTYEDVEETHKSLSHVRTSTRPEPTPTQVEFMRSKGYEKDPTDGWIYVGKPASGGADEPDEDDLNDLATRKYTCKPNYKACIHPCVNGCADLGCLCYEGSPEHPTESGRIARFFGGNTLGERDSGNGQKDRVAYDPTSGGVIEGTIVEEEVQCAGCERWLNENDTNELQLGDTRWTLCEACWKLESEAPFRRKSSPGSGLAVRTENEVRKEADKIHSRAIAELAYELNTTPRFVTWLVFSCTDDELRASPSLKSLYESIAHEYRNAHALASDLHNGVYSGG
jgi:hypothetical protein